MQILFRFISNSATVPSAVSPSIVIADQHIWDRGVEFRYQLNGTNADALGNLKIGQLQKNAGTSGYNHGMTQLYTNGSPRMTIDKDGNVGIGEESPTNKLDIEFEVDNTGDEIVTRSYIVHTSGTGTANGTSIQGKAKSNSHSGTANMIGVHGFSEDVATGVTSRDMKFIGVKGAVGTTNGTTTAYGGYFTIRCKQ